MNEEKLAKLLDETLGPIENKEQYLKNLKKQEDLIRESSLDILKMMNKFNKDTIKAIKDPTLEGLSLSFISFATTFLGLCFNGVINCLPDSDSVKLEKFDDIIAYIDDVFEYVSGGYLDLKKEYQSYLECQK